MSDQHSFSAKRVFITLFILTAVEVAWGELMPYDNKLLLWGGLLAFAFWKGALIFMYFMHMKFEGWIIKGLLAPTPLLIAIVLCAVMPDVSFNNRLDWDVGAQLDKTGRDPGHVVRNMDLYDGEHGGHGAPEGAGKGAGEEHAGGH